MRFGCWVGLGVALIASAAASEPHAIDARLVVDQWTVRDGLPIDHLVDITQDADGMLWIASFDGLIRFDGHRLTTFRGGSRGLPSNRVIDVHASQAGDVWLTTEYGQLVRWGDPPRTWTPEGTGMRSMAALHEGAGQLWLSSESGLARIVNGEPESPPVVAALQGVREPVIRPDGVWFLADAARVGFLPTRGPVVWRELSASLDLLPSQRYFSCLREAPDGTLWVGANFGLAKVTRDGIEPIFLSHIQPADVRQLGWSSTGEMWAMTAKTWLRGPPEQLRPVPGGASNGELIPQRFRGGLLRADATTVYVDDRPLAFVGVPTRGLFVDRAEDIWVATEGRGLLRIRPAPLSTVVQGDDFHSLNGVQFDRAGRPWLLSSDRGTWMGTPDRDTFVRVEHPMGAENHRWWRSMSMLERPSGDVLLGAWHGLCRIPSARIASGAPYCEPIAIDQDPDDLMDVRAMIDGDEDGLWVASKGGIWRGVEAAGGLRLTRMSAERHGRALLRLPDGRVLASLPGGGILALPGDERLTPGEGPSGGVVRGLTLDRDGRIWVGMEAAGLCRVTPAERWSESTVRCLDPESGVEDGVHVVADDGHRRLWASTNRGLFTLDKAAANAVLDGERDHLWPVWFDDDDGMLNRELNGGYQAAVARASDGALWFPSQRGAVRVHPAHVAFPDAPMPILLSARSGEEALPVGGPLSLDAERPRIELDWTAVTLRHANDVRYRHRLRGFDDEWSAPDREHRASWTNLPPGSYTFEVMAGIGGRWSPPASIAVHRAPTFAETGWFTGLMVLLVFGLMATAFRWRTRVLVRRQADLERMVDARTGELAVANGELAAQARRLQEVDELKTHFFATLSHELRTPLTLIRGPLEDLAAARARPEDEPTLQVIRNNADRLGELIDQLLELARLDAGGVPLRARQIELGGFVRKVTDRFQLHPQRTGVTLALRTPDAPIPLFIDPDLMDKVITNLLGNAFKFSREGGCVEVEVDSQADELGEGRARIVVRDRGIGIDASELERLFDRFYQIDRGHARRYEGVGLGLALARELVELHGGEISAASEVGQGSAFTVVLPLGAEHLTPDEISLDAPPDAVAPVPTEPDDDVELPTALIAEDHPDMRAYLVAHFTGRYRVLEAADGAAALALAREHVPDVIVSDVMMPELDGIELSRRLRADPALQAIPIVLVSARTSESARVAGLELADDYVPKPFRMRELLARVARLVRPGPARAAEPPPEPEPEPAPEPPREARTPPAEEPPPEVEDAPPAEAGLPEADQAYLARLDEVLRANLAVDGFGVNQLASAMGASRRQLLRDVRRLLDVSPVELIKDTRMRAARELLEAGTYSTVSEVAAAVGLSKSYFSRLYSNHFGVSPSDDLRQ